MSPKRKWGESKALVIKAHGMGLTVKQTAKQFGLSVMTVRNLVARLGVTMAPEKRGSFDKVTRKYAEYKFEDIEERPRGESEEA
jgi:transposase